MININDLSLMQQNNALLLPTSFHIEPNKLNALIGHNGSGKSSLIKAFVGEMALTKGRIQIEKEYLQSLSAKRLATHLTYLPQKLPDAGALTVYEFIMLGRYSHKEWLQNLPPMTMNK